MAKKITFASEYFATFVAPEQKHRDAMSKATRKNPDLIAAAIIAIVEADAAKAKVEKGKNDAFKSALKHGAGGDFSYLAEREQRTHLTAGRRLAERWDVCELTQHSDLTEVVHAHLQTITGNVASIAGINDALKAEESKADKAKAAPTSTASDSEGDSDAAPKAKRTKAQFLDWVLRQYATEFDGADFFADLESGKLDAAIDFDETIAA